MSDPSGRAQLGFAALILVAVAVALLVAGPGPAGGRPGEGATDTLDPSELARLSVASTPAVARRVERVRELEFDRVPQPEVVSAEYLNRLGARELERERGPLGLAGDDAVGRITGLLEPGESLRAALDSTGDLAAAAYDPRTDRLYVVADAVVGSPGLVDFVLSHELGHAIEDQAFGISGGARLGDDAALARQALIEGSATSLMTEYAARFIDPFELIAAAETIDAGAGEVPDVLVDQLTWTYFGGMRFVDALRTTAQSWKLVDYAFGHRPPSTTEQVLHPRKYVVDEPPAPISIDAATALRARGWRLADRAEWGELGTSLLLRVGVDAERARAAAAGWDGDRYELWRREAAPGRCEYPCRAELVLAITWAWDTAADRDEFATAAADYVHDGLGGEAIGANGFRVPGGAVRLAHTGPRATTLVFAPGPGLAEAVARAQRPARD